MLYTARPALAVDGTEDPALALGLITLTVTEAVDGLFCCEANFGNWGSVDGQVGYLYFDRQVFDFGREFSVQMGDGDAAGQVFDGRITALEGRFPMQRPPEIQLLAEDRFQELRMTRRTRTFEGVTDADVIDLIAGEHGLSADVDVDGPNYRVLAQLNQSDLAFVRDRARAVDAEVWLDATTLHVQARSRRRTVEVSLTYGQRLREFQVSADLAVQRSDVTVSGWDIGAKDAIAESAGVAAIQGELNDGEAGSTILDQALGARSEEFVHCVPLSTQEATTLAEAHYRSIARRFICGHGVAEGDGRIRAGAHLELNNLGALFDGVYYVTEVRHAFDDRSGFRTHFSVERSGLGGTQ